MAKGSGYILEDLRPRTTYDLRFGCKNRVGFSVWGARQQITMPRKGRPEPPVLNTDQFGEVGERGEVVELNTSNSYELSWQIPEDNGLPIDYFLLQYYPVRLGGMWAKPMVGYTILNYPFRQHSIPALICNSVNFSFHSQKHQQFFLPKNARENKNTTQNKKQEKRVLAQGLSKHNA